MPIGVEYNYVIFRRDSLLKAEQRLKERDDLDALVCVQNMLSSPLSDSYLVADESMAPFEDIDFLFWTERLGLTYQLGLSAIDFYLPDINVPDCDWLEFSPIRESSYSSLEEGSIIWDGYRFIGDTSRIVCVGSTEESPKKTPDFFPERGTLINRKMYKDMDFSMIGKDIPDWLKT